MRAQYPPEICFFVNLAILAIWPHLLDWITIGNWNKLYWENGWAFTKECQLVAPLKDCPSII